MSLKALKVLFLDDEPALCIAFEALFSSETVEVTTFTDAAQAINAALINPPDIIFLDYRLPGTNGFDVARAMAKDIPKYLITAEISVPPNPDFLAIFYKPIDIATVEGILQDRINSLKLHSLSRV